MVKRNVKKIIIFATFLIYVTVFSDATYAQCPIHIKTPFSAVGLFKTDLLDWLENENQLDTLCPTHDQVCTTKALSPLIDKIPVYDHPFRKVIADLEITYTPGKGMTASLVQSGKVYPFELPIYASDWSYGPYFHATLLDKRGVWKNVALPRILSGWIELPEAEIYRLNAKNQINLLDGHEIVIIKSDSKSLTFREIQSHDMWENGDKGSLPPLARFKKHIIPVSRAYDNKCNLRLLPEMTKGC